MAKFDPKKADLNKDGKLSDYESNVGQKRAAAMKMDHSPKSKKQTKSATNMKKDYSMKMGYAMKMGSKQNDSPSAFNMKDAMLMYDAPMMMHKEGHDDPAKEISLEGVTPSGGKKTSLSKDKIKSVIEDQKQYDKNVQRSMQNLAEIDSLKLVASGESKKAKMLYGPKYTSDKKFQNPAYIQGSASYVDSKPNIKARIEKRKKLKNKAINISGARPSL